MATSGAVPDPEQSPIPHQNISGAGELQSSKANYHGMDFYVPGFTWALRYGYCFIATPNMLRVSYPTRFTKGESADE